MKAALFNRYGPAEVLEIREVPAPKPGGGKFLLEVHACGLNPKDDSLRSGLAKWISTPFFPKKTGYDFAGVVLKAPTNADSTLSAGTRVFGYIPSLRGGSAAEMMLARPTWLAPLPEELDFIRAAALPCASLSALQALRDLALLKKGDSVLIYGASGGVGTAALEIGAYFGLKMTAVCSSRNREYALSKGAKEVRAYDEGDIFAAGGQFDCFFQVKMHRNSIFRKASRMLGRNGTFVTTAPGPGPQLRQLISRLGIGKRYRSLIVKSRRKDLDLLAQLALSGKVSPPIEVMPFDEIVAAHRQGGSGHTRGKIVLDLRQ